MSLELVDPLKILEDLKIAPGLIIRCCAVRLLLRSTRRSCWPPLRWMEESELFLKSQEKMTTG